MKPIHTNLLRLACLCLVVAGFSGCTPSEQAGTNTPPATAADAKKSEDKSGQYPPLASSLANGELETLEGAKTKIVDMKGKVLLLNIWGIWCGPCRAEMPHLVEMKNKYGERGFDVVGMNIGDQAGAPEGVDAIKTFAGKMGLNYTLVRSPVATTQQFYKVTKQQVVPQSLVIDRNGHLRGVFIGGGQRVIESMKETVAKTMDE